MPPAIGEPVPNFEGLLCDGEVFEDTELTTVVGDRGAVLVFYGFAFSAIARHWWTRYTRRDWHEFDEVPVLGVGRDGPFAQNEFLRDVDAPFRIYADVDGNACSAFDLLHSREGMAGVSTPRRSVFVVDPDLEVQFRWVAENEVAPPPADEIEEAVNDLPGSSGSE